MRVLLVSQYFWPESFRINEVASSLVERGLDTTVLTGKPNYPDGMVFKGYRALGCSTERWNGARVYRVPLLPRGHKSGLRLALNYLSFVISGLVFGTWVLRRERPDVIFCYAPSPLIQVLPALWLGWIKRAPVVVNVQDLWPESLEATGYVKNRLVLALVERVVKFIYRRADLILVSSKPFAASIQRFSPKGRVIYYPNSVEASFCDSNSGSKPAVPALDAGFSVVFAGNIGSAQAVGVIVQAAKLLKSQTGIRFVVLGSGSELDWMVEQKRLLQLDNLYLGGRFPVDAMPYLLAKAAVLLVTLADQPIFATTVPNKIQAYMAVGRPIIACMNGEGARLVLEADAGIAVAAEDGKGLADAVMRLFSMSSAERDRLAANAQTYYREHFDHEKLVSELVQHFEDVRRVRS